MFESGRVVPGTRRVARTASTGEEGNQESPCAIDRPRTYPPPKVEAGSVSRIPETERASAAGTEADFGASHSAQAYQAPGLPSRRYCGRFPLLGLNVYRGRTCCSEFLVSKLRCQCGNPIRFANEFTEEWLRSTELWCRAPETPPVC